MVNSNEVSRRKFLNLVVGSAYLPLLSAPLAAAVHKSVQQSGRRLILVELAGANDGLNTLIPYKDHRYHELRPSLALSEDSVVVLQDDFAIHQGLQDLMPLWEKGELAFMHGLGYPNPNRSHFKSRALWERGGDGNRSGPDGWITHDIEHALAIKEVDAHGISLGGGMGIFSSNSGNWLSMATADQYLNRAITRPDRTLASNSALDQVLQQTQILSQSLDNISDKLQQASHRSSLAGSELALQLNHAVNLINAGITSPVLKVSLGGFDTHANQSVRHRRLLTVLGRALLGARRELMSSGEWNNTLVVTYSEFGRRAHENHSGGTDHGTAAAHFVMGGAVRGGLYGDAPDLGSLVQGDLQHTMDYRALYNEILSEWFSVRANRFMQFKDSRVTSLLG